MDLLSLIVPIKTDVMKVSPWGMFGFMGTKSLMGNIKGGDPATWAPRAGLYPILGSGYTFETFPFRRNTETHENAWWARHHRRNEFFFAAHRRRGFRLWQCEDGGNPGV